MDPFKAPGPDGFHAGFFQCMWDIVGDSIIKFARNFFDKGCLLERVNDTLLVLIPKVKYSETIKQLRPISLCNVCYKIVTKVMTTRLKSVLPQLIGPFQSNFVPGHQITDNILIYQEVLHSMKKKQGVVGLMAIKIDLEKADDRLSWDFIKDTIMEVGLNHTWIRNLMHGIESSRLSILWMVLN